MRRPTLIMIIVLFVLIVIAGVAQFRIASRDQGPYQGPSSPGQLPTTDAPTPSP